MCLHILQIAWVWHGSLCREDEVVLAPNDQGRRLTLPEKALKRRVKRHVRAVVVKQIHLDVAVAGTIKTDLIDLNSAGVFFVKNPQTQATVNNLINLIGTLIESILAAVL